MFENTAIKQNVKGNKSRRCFRFYNDVTDSEEKKMLLSNENEDPVLVIFRRRHVFYSSYIVGDENVIYTESDNLAHSLLLYAGCYKVFTIDLPKPFVPFVSIIMYFIFNEPWCTKWGRQTASYLNVKELLDKEIKRGFICSGIGKQK